MPSDTQQSDTYNKPSCLGVTEQLRLKNH